MKRAFIPGVVLLAAGLAAIAGDTWKNRAPAEWTEKEVVEFLSQSPWSKEVTVWQLTGEKTNQVVRQQDRVYQDAPREVAATMRSEERSVEATTVDATYGVRWVSAGIAQQAWERLRELNPAQAEQLAPPEGAAAQHVLTLRVVKPPPAPTRAIFAGMSETALVGHATLRTSGKRTLKPLRAQQHGKGAAEAVSFFFAREESGAATLPAGTGWVKFGFVSTTGDRLEVTFRVKEMVYEGKTDY